jgi:hypothetical protein
MSQTLTKQLHPCVVAISVFHSSELTKPLADKEGGCPHSEAMAFEYSKTDKAIL